MKKLKEKRELILLICLIFFYNLSAQLDTTYYKNGQIESIGEFHNNKRHGEWRWFYKNGQLMSIENYKHGIFKDGKFWNEHGDSITINEILILPKYPKGGMKGFVKFISKELEYPVLAIEYNLQGKVIVDFNVDKYGELVDFKIYKSVNKLLDEEAIRVIKKSGKWIPGTLHGMPVKIAMRFPIDFNLQ